MIEHATCHQPQAATNYYQQLIVGVGSSNGSQPNREDPYHVTTDEIAAIRNVCYSV